MSITKKFWPIVAKDLEHEFNNGHPKNWTQADITVFLDALEQKILEHCQKDKNKAQKLGIPIIKGKWAFEQWRSIDPSTFRKIFRYKTSNGSPKTKHQFAMYLGYKSFEDYINKRMTSFQ